MSELQKALEECLVLLETGRATIEECLARFPEYAGELEPLLLKAQELKTLHGIHISEVFKANTRNELLNYMGDHPTRAKNQRGHSGLSLKLASGLAILLLAFAASGTALAQRALPGDSLYAWKLASENLWLLINPDDFETALWLSTRRFEELLAVRGNAVLEPISVEAYLDSIQRVTEAADAESLSRASEVIGVQWEALQKAGFRFEDLEDFPGPLAEPDMQEGQRPDPEDTPKAGSTATEASKIPNTPVVGDLEVTVQPNLTLESLP